MRYLLLLLFCALALAPGLATAQERSYLFERIDVELQLHTNGTLDVVEHYTYRFTGGPFQRALRGIPRDGVDDIRNVRLSEGGQEYRSAFRGEEPGTYIVENNADELLVRWFYPPTSDAARTFTLSYTVDGAIYVDEEFDELWWVAVFPERDVPVERASVTLRLPEGAGLSAADVSLPGAEAEEQVEPERVTLSRDTPLPPGEALELRVELDPDLIDAPVPAWQEAGDAPPADDPAAPAEPRPNTQPAPSGGSGFDLIFCLIVALILIFVVLPLLNRMMRSADDYGDWGGGYGGGYGGGWGGGWGSGYGGSSRRKDRGGGWGGGWGDWGGSSSDRSSSSSRGSWGRSNRSGGSWGGSRSGGSFGGGRSGGSWGGSSRRSSSSRGSRRSGGGRGGAG